MSAGKEWRRWLEQLERAVVAIAAALALFPLYQWWQERDDRRLDRLANVVAAVEFCERLYERPDSFDDMATLDIHEELCSEVVSHFNLWEEEVYAAQ